MKWAAHWAKIKIYLLGSALSGSVMQELEAKMIAQPTFPPVSHFGGAKWLLFCLIWRGTATGGNSHTQWEQIRLAHCGWQIIVPATPPSGPECVCSQVLSMYGFPSPNSCPVILTFLSSEGSQLSYGYNSAENLNPLSLQMKSWELRERMEWGELNLFMSHPWKFLVYSQKCVSANARHCSGCSVIIHFVG